LQMTVQPSISRGYVRPYVVPHRLYAISVPEGTLWRERETFDFSDLLVFFPKVVSTSRKIQAFTKAAYSSQVSIYAPCFHVVAINK